MTRRSALALGTAVLAMPFVMRGALAQVPGWRDLEEVRALVGDAFPFHGNVALNLPSIWEDGSAVALDARVDLPLLGPSRVRDLTIFTPANPAKEVARYHFTPQGGRAEIATRIRLNATQTVVAIARTEAGSVHYAERAVAVAVSGCVGTAGATPVETLMLARARGPDRFVRGAPAEIATLINHPQQNGGQVDAAGNPLPVNLVTGLTATLAGETLFSADFGRGVTANPYLRFFVAPQVEGDLVIAWTEDQGRSAEVIVPVRF